MNEQFPNNKVKRIDEIDATESLNDGEFGFVMLIAKRLNQVIDIINTKKLLPKIEKLKVEETTSYDDIDLGF
jgi:hypothetical protein